MSNQLLRKSKVVTSQLRGNLPDFKTGCSVEVHYKVLEGDKERVQIFKGVVIAKKGSGKSLDDSFTVLKNSTKGIKVERVFPLHSPMIDKIVLASDLQRSRRSKLYYLKKTKEVEKTAKVKRLKQKA